MDRYCQAESETYYCAYIRCTEEAVLLRPVLVQYTAGELNSTHLEQHEAMKISCGVEPVWCGKDGSSVECMRATPGVKTDPKYNCCAVAILLR